MHDPTDGSIGSLTGLLPDALIQVPPDGSIRLWSGAATQLFGWKREEAEGKDLHLLLKPRDENGNPTSLIGDGAGPETYAMVTTKSGEDTWVAVTSHPSPDGQILLARDINYRRMIDIEKSEVVSSVSHELRSPLTSIKGFTRTLLNRWDRLDDETKKHFLMMMNNDCDRVTRLINELLDLSRIEAGRLQLRRRMIDFVALAEGVYARLQPQAENHRIHIDLSPDLPKAYADPDKVDQVLTNLVENAIKYTEKGKVTVSAQVNKEMVVSVSDEGEGIPEEDRLSVFGKFYRRDDRTAARSGTGLGLYIAKGLIEGHGGQMWVEEAPGGGARFVFTLPLQEPATLAE